MLERRPKVAANLAPPSYCSTSATVNRLATADPNPRSVPGDFWPEFEDPGARSVADTHESVGLDHNSALEASGLLPRSPFRILQGKAQLLREVVDRRALPLPRAVGLEAERADAAAPR